MCSCCDHYFSLTVIANNALATPTASPVTLTVDRPLTDMPVGGCFDLVVPKALLKNANVSPVELSDGATTLPLLTRCTDPLRYDSLVDRARECDRCGTVVLRCSRRTEPAPGHVACATCLPRSSYAAASTPTGGGAGA